MLMTPRKIKITDSHTPCSINCYPVNGLTKVRKKWLKEHELYEADTNYGPRIMTPVYIAVLEPDSIIYMMDAVTGSLYDIPTGKCLTSSMVYMKGFVPKKGLDKKLLGMRPEYER
jgi:hypothetical protein